MSSEIGTGRGEWAFHCSECGVEGPGELAWHRDRCEAHSVPALRAKVEALTAEREAAKGGWDGALAATHDLARHVAEMMRERDEARETARAMHRRAQKLEGIDARFETVKENMMCVAQGMRAYEARKVAWWKNYYRTACKQIRDAGVDDSWRDEQGRELGTGNLNILIARLIFERDDARAQVERLRGELANHGGGRCARVLPAVVVRHEIIFDDEVKCPACGTIYAAEYQCPRCFWGAGGAP